MGLIQRILNIGRSKANAALDNIEDPLQLLDQKILDMKESLNSAKLSSADVFGNAHNLETKINAAKVESSDWDSKVKKAVAAGNDDLAKKALAKKIEKDGELARLTASYEQAKIQSDKLKVSITTLENEITTMESRKTELAARAANADAMTKVNEIIADVESRTNSISIGDIEDKIEKKEAHAAGLGDLADMAHADEKEFAALDAVDLDAELAKYKNQ